jgi:membrane-bound lytic murein transglycosylase B
MPLCAGGRDGTIDAFRLPMLAALRFSRRSFLSLAALGLALPSPFAGAAAHKTAKRSARATRTPKADDDPGYAARAEVRAFVDAMVAEHGFARAELLRLFREVRFQPRIVAAMDRPIVAPPKWFEYAPNFLRADRIEAGSAYWRGHAAALTRAEAEYGVPPPIVLGILGVESFYGRNVGSYRVIDALAPLACLTQDTL